MPGGHIDVVAGETRKIIEAPEKMCFYAPKWRSLFFNFIMRLHDLAIRNNSLVTIDLRGLKEMSSGAALLLFAYTSIAQIVNGRNAVNYLYPKNEELRKIFVDTGLRQALAPGGLDKLERLWKGDSMFQYGANASRCIELTVAMLERRYGRLPEHLVTAISEALLNVGRHAYVKESVAHKGLFKRWWQYCYKTDDRLHFLIFDSGIGIPGNLQAHLRPDKRPVFWGDSLADKQLIAYAMERGVSTIGSPGRGQGSEDIKKPSASSMGDYLLIMSGSGMYRQLGDDKTELSDLPSGTVVRGTFIEWSLHCGGKHDDES